MSYDNLLENNVGTVDATSDHFGQLFPLSTDAKTTTQPVWHVASPSAPSISTEQFSKTMAQLKHTLLANQLLNWKRKVSSSGTWIATSDEVAVRSWLTASATTGNATMSAQAIENINIANLEPQNIVQIIRLALVAGANIHARQLAMQAVEHYPEHAELAKMAHIFSRPKATIIEGAPDSSGRVNQLWLDRNYKQYKGQWVALQNGELITVADTAKELKEKVSNFAGMMVTRV